MINESAYAALAARLQEAYADLEQHLDDPDSSHLSGQGMLELTRDRLASITAALFAPGMPPIRRPVAATSSSSAGPWQDTRADDGRWLSGQGACPHGCGHVLMAHRSDVGCISCDCQHGITDR